MLKLIMKIMNTAIICLLERFSIGVPYQHSAYMLNSCKIQMYSISHLWISFSWTETVKFNTNYFNVTFDFDLKKSRFIFKVGLVWALLVGSALTSF